MSNKLGNQIHEMATDETEDSSADPKITTARNRLVLLLEEHIDRLALSLDENLKLVLAQYEQLQQDEKKGELSHIYFSFLTSSVLCKLPWIRIDLYDQNDRCDMTPCWTDWDITPVSDVMYRDAMIIHKKEQLRSYKLKSLWLREAPKYEDALLQVLPNLLTRYSCRITVPVSFHFGQYLGKSEQFFVMGNDGNLDDPPTAEGACV